MLLQSLVPLCCIVVATRLTQEDARAIEPACDARPSANAKADALTTRAGMTSKNDFNYIGSCIYIYTSTTLNDPKQ